MPMLSSHGGGGAWPGGFGGIPPGLFGGSGSLFGDGTYSGNVMQGGSVLQPQASYSFGAADQVSGYGYAYELPFYAGYFFVDKNYALVAGEPVTALGMIDSGTGGATLSIVKRVSAGNYVVAKRLDFTRTGTGVLKYFDLSTPFVVPSDGYTYHIGCACTSGSGSYGSGSAPTAYTTSNPAEGASVSLTETTGGTFYVGARYKQTTLTNALVVTGAATVAPDGTTGACAVTGANIVVAGSGATLAPSTNNKGLLLFASESIRQLNGGRIHNDKLGKAGNFGDLTAHMLLPASVRKKINKVVAGAYTVLGEGAAGAAGKYGTSLTAGNTGSAASSMQSGGGGSGAVRGGGANTSGAGGKGGPCCGGAGSGAVNSVSSVTGPAAGAYGGPGGNAVGNNAGEGVGGGAGDPVGAGAQGGSAGTGAGGGLCMLFAPAVSVASGCIVSADGAAGGTGGSYPIGGGGGGGGCMCICTLTGGYSNSGTVRASGGAGGAGNAAGGAGGAGSVNTFTV